MGIPSLKYRKATRKTFIEMFQQGYNFGIKNYLF